MRRNKAFTRGRVLSIVVAAFAGYVIGGWNGSVPHGSTISAAQAVALRFPQDFDDAAAAATPVTTIVAAQFALLSPQPLAPQAAAQPAAIQQSSAPDMSAPPAAMQVASADATMPLPHPAPTTRPAPVKPAVAARRTSERPGFILNDAQIASIKDRLRLTPGQEEMWPAVEAALRNLAYARARDAHQRGAPAAGVQVASADPDVQDLKSAAIPLIMSFNAEQKDEVRSLAHVMGLDQLASQF
jgi:hypothetical protein